MKEFLQVLRRFVPPYKKYLALSVIFNILSAVLNIFSFMTIMPILQILFKTGDATSVTTLTAWDWGNLKESLTNFGEYYVGRLIAEFGPSYTPARHRPVSRLRHVPEDGGLLPFLGHHHPHPHGRSA